MESTLIPDLAEITATRLQREVDAKQNDLAPEETPDFLLACDLVAQAFEQFRAHIAALLDRGVEARSLHQLLALKGVPQANLVLGICRRLRDRIPASDLPHLSAAIEKIERVHADFTRLVDWLAPTPPPAGLASLSWPPAESREGYESLTSVRARLKSGGDL